MSGDGKSFVKHFVAALVGSEVFKGDMPKLHIPTVLTETFSIAQAGLQLATLFPQPLSAESRGVHRDFLCTAPFSSPGRSKLGGFRVTFWDMCKTSL